MSSPAFLTLIDRLLAAGVTFGLDLAGVPDDGAVVLTFDDATRDHQALGRELADRGVPAIFFVPAGLLGLPGYLDEADLQELVAAGHVIGSHGWSHKRLDLLPSADLAAEFESSRAKLEDLTGAPVTLFAPAGGIAIPSLPRRLEAAGYIASRSTRWGIQRPRGDRWSIPTVPVTPVTADRGWVASAATERRLPVAMIALGAVRDVLGPGARTALRGQLHRRHARPRLAAATPLAAGPPLAAAPPLPEDPAHEVV